MTTLFAIAFAISGIDLLITVIEGDSTSIKLLSSNVIKEISSGIVFYSLSSIAKSRKTSHYSNIDKQ